MSQPSTSTEPADAGSSERIEIVVNDKRHECPVGSTVADLLQSLSLRSGPVAVEQNLQIVASDQFAETILKSGDQLEIVSLTGGG